MKRKHKTSILIVLMTALAIYCLYYIFFIPHTASMLYRMARMNMGDIDCFTEQISAKTIVVLDQTRIESLKEIGEDQIEVPITIEINSAIGPGSMHMTRAIEYEVFGEIAMTETDAYLDTEHSIIYVERADGWSKRSDTSQYEIDINYMLAIQNMYLKEARFEKDNSYFYLKYPADHIGTELVKPFVRDPDNITVLGGEVTFWYERRTKTLRHITTKDMLICDSKFVGTDQESGATSSIDVKLTFNELNEVSEDRYLIPETVKESARSTDEIQQGKQILISTADLTKRNKTSYAVGVDIPPGNYIVRRKDGLGIMKVLSGADATERMVFSSGYDYYKIDNESPSKEIELLEGDRILLSGDEYELTLTVKKNEDS